MPSGFTLFDDKKRVSKVDLGCRTKSTPGASAGALGAEIAVLGADRWCPELSEKYSAPGCRKKVRQNRGKRESGKKQCSSALVS